MVITGVITLVTSVAFWCVQIRCPRAPLGAHRTLGLYLQVPLPGLSYNRVLFDARGKGSGCTAHQG